MTNTKSLSGYFAALLLFVAIGGCSQTTRFYTLAPIETEALISPPASDTPRVIAIGPVAIPDYVDRPQIVVRTSSNTVIPASFNHWAGGLDNMLPSLLVEDLGTRLPATRFVEFSQVGHLDFDYRVPVSISRFDVSETGGAVIVAQWQVRARGGNGNVLLRESEVQADVTGTEYEDMVVALSRAIALLTDEIAAELSQHD
jgi:uncharacterized lipoprotein YmbA